MTKQETIIQSIEMMEAEDIINKIIEPLLIEFAILGLDPNDGLNGELRNDAKEKISELLTVYKVLTQ